MLRHISCNVISSKKCSLQRAQLYWLLEICIAIQIRSDIDILP